MSKLPYYNIPETPDQMSATSVIARMVDGIAFRYRWATEGLTNEDFEFRPVSSSMNMSEVMHHIYDLAYSAHRRFGGNETHDQSKRSIEELRETTLRLYSELSERLKEMSDEDLAILEQNSNSKQSFWYWINGPLADVLTHVGQITTWRRINNNPQPKGVSVFLGKGI